MWVDKFGADREREITDGALSSIQFIISIVHYISNAADTFLPLAFI